MAGGLMFPTWSDDDSFRLCDQRVQPDDAYEIRFDFGNREFIPAPPHALDRISTVWHHMPPKCFRIDSIAASGRAGGVMEEAGTSVITRRNGMVEVINRVFVNEVDAIVTLVETPLKARIAELECELARERAERAAATATFVRPPSVPAHSPPQRNHVRSDVLEHWRQFSGKLEARVKGLEGRNAQQRAEIDSLTNNLTAAREKRADAERERVLLLDDLQETAEQFEREKLRADLFHTGREGAQKQLNAAEVELAEIDCMLDEHLGPDKRHVIKRASLIGGMGLRIKELAEARVTADTDAQQLREGMRTIAATIDACFNTNFRSIAPESIANAVANNLATLVRVEAGNAEKLLGERDEARKERNELTSRLYAASACLCDALQSQFPDLFSAADEARRIRESRETLLREVEGLKNDVRKAEEAENAERASREATFRELRDVRRLLDPINGRPRLTMRELAAAVSSEIGQAREAVRSAADALAERKDVA